MNKYNKNLKKAFQHLESADVSPLEVKVNGNFEESVKKFRSLFQKERIIGILKEKSSYEKPSEKKRRKRREAAERRLLADSREKMIKSGEWDKRAKKKQQKKEMKEEERRNKNIKHEEFEGYDE